MRRPLVVPVVVLLACGFAACGSSDEAAPTTPSTTASSTTVSSTTTTSTPAATTTTTVAAPADTCTDRDVAGSVSDASTFDDFGPLGEVPSVVIDVPVWTDQSGQVTERSVRSAQVPGGVIVGITSFEQSVVAAFDRDGTLRWRRCEQIELHLPEQSAGLDAVVAATRDSDQREEFGALNPADGTWMIEPGDIDLVPDPGISYWSGSVIGDLQFLQPVDDVTGMFVSSESSLRVIDLRTLDVVVVDPAPSDQGGPMGLSDGRVAWVANGAAVGVLDGTRWVTDAALSSLRIPMARPTVPTTGGPVSALFAADGTELWRRDDLRLLSGELPGQWDLGDTVVARTCADDPCSDSQLIGLDATNGATVWTRSEYSALIDADGGLALVTSADGAAMIDVATGAIVPGQTWERASLFPQGCCGDPSFTRVDGGVVISGTETEISLWYPRAESQPTVRVTLFG